MKRFEVIEINQQQLEENWNAEELTCLYEEAKNNVGNAYIVNTRCREIRLSECSLTDSKAMDSFNNGELIVVTHRGFAHDGVDFKQKKLFDAYRFAKLKRLIASGIVVNGVQYDFYTSTAADLKVGKCRMIRHDIKIAHGRELMFMRNKELKNWSANEECKVKSTLLSGSELAPGGITVSDVCIVPSIEHDNNFFDTIVLDKNGNITVEKDKKVKTTHFDGQMMLINWHGELDDLPAVGQGRLGCMKLTWLVVPGWMLRARAKALGVKLPEYIVDFFGNKRKLNTIRAIATEDVVKGLKWFNSFDDLCDSLKAMGVDKLRACRYCEPSKNSNRTLSRQALQELAGATEEELNELASIGSKSLAELKTVEGQLKELARQTQGYHHEIFSAYPELLANKEVYDFRKQNWENKFADRMVSPVLSDSHYEQIAEDPIAFIDIVLFGVNASNAGVLKAGECFCFAPEGKEVYGIRHPANLINARILRSTKNVWLRAFEGIGVFVLPFDDPTLTGYWDGDVDGDESFWSTNKLLVKLAKRTIAQFNPLPLVFPHDKAVKGDYPKSKLEWATEMAKLLFNGVEYNLVGKYSNLATKILTDLRPGQRNGCIRKAVYAHVMSILCLDFVKTGTLPVNIKAKADALLDTYRKMPFNQRYMKHSAKAARYYDNDWDEEKGSRQTLLKSDCVVDRYGDAMRGKVIEDSGSEEFDIDISNLQYDDNMMLYDVNCQYIRGTKPTETMQRVADITGYTWKQKDSHVGITEMLALAMSTTEHVGFTTDEKSKDADINETFELCRKAITELVKANRQDLTDSEALRLAADNAWKMLKVKRDNGTNNGMYTFFLLNLFGDVYARNVFMNKAPLNVVEE